MLSLEAKVIALIVALLAVLAIGYTTYQHIYNKGSAACDAEWTTRHNEAVDELNKKLEAKEKESTADRVKHQQEIAVLTKKLGDYNVVIGRLRDAEKAGAYWHAEWTKLKDLQIGDQRVYSDDQVISLPLGDGFTQQYNQMNHEEVQ